MKRKNSQHSRTNPERQVRGENAAHSTPVVLGIDPGTLVTGYGVLRAEREGTKLLTCGAIRNNAQTPLPRRLRHIHDEISRIIETYSPSEFAIESAFYGKNAQSALKLGHARGVLVLAAAHHGLAVSEYSPREIKKAVTGRGNASKPQIRFMVRSLVDTGNGAMSLDASDAIAAAICHLQRFHRRERNTKDWKSFVALHPERVLP